MLREQIAQRLYQELSALSGSAAKQLSLSVRVSAAVGVEEDPIDQFQQHILALANAVLMNSAALFEGHVLH